MSEQMSILVPSPLKSCTSLEFADTGQVTRSGGSFSMEATFHGKRLILWQLQKDIWHIHGRGLAAYFSIQPTYALDSWFLWTHPGGLAARGLHRSTFAQALHEDARDLGAFGFLGVRGYSRLSKQLTSSPRFFPLPHEAAQQSSSGVHGKVSAHPAIWILRLPGSAVPCTALTQEELFTVSWSSSVTLGVPFPVTWLVK